MKGLRNIKTHAKLGNSRNSFLSRFTPVAKRFYLVEEERRLQDRLEEIKLGLAEIQKERAILCHGHTSDRKTRRIPHRRNVTIHSGGGIKV